MTKKGKTIFFFGGGLDLETQIDLKIVNSVIDIYKQMLVCENM